MQRLEEPADLPEQQHERNAEIARERTRLFTVYSDTESAAFIETVGDGMADGL